jgi:hypothetical protein
MLVRCNDNEFFEDVLEVGEFYSAEQGVNGYGIQNERGRFAWYGQDKFEVVIGSVTVEDRMK